MGKKRKRRRPTTMCLIDSENRVIKRSRSSRELEHLQRAWDREGDSNRMEIISEEDLNERFHNMRAERKRIQGEQDKAYEIAARQDKEKELKRQLAVERRTILKNNPEERAKLFDTLFLNRNPRYKASKMRVWSVA